MHQSEIMAVKTALDLVSSRVRRGFRFDRRVGHCSRPATALVVNAYRVERRQSTSLARCDPSCRSRRTSVRGMGDRPFPAEGSFDERIRRGLKPSSLGDLQKLLLLSPGRGGLSSS